MFGNLLCVLALSGAFIEPHASTICSAEGDDPDKGGGGNNDDPDKGGGGDKDKKFTQEDVNNLIAKEKKSLLAKFADYDTIKEKAGKVDDLEARFAKLQEDKDLEGKSELEKERLRADKAERTLKAQIDQLTRERDEARGLVDVEKKSHRTTRASTQLSAALNAADVFPGAITAALRSLMEDSDVDYDDNGELVSLTLKHNGTRYSKTELKKAAESFLQENPFYAKGAGGGGGTRRQSGGGGANSKPLSEMTTAELLAADKARGGAAASK